MTFAQPRPGVRTEHDFDLQQHRFPVQTLRPGQQDMGIPNMLVPEQNPERLEEIRRLAILYDPAWQADPRFDDLVKITSSMAGSDPEMWQLMRDGWTAAASVAYTDFYNRAQGDITDPIAFNTQLIRTARQMLAREDAAFLSTREWLTRGRQQHEFSMLINQVDLDPAREAAAALLPEQVRQFAEQFGMSTVDLRFDIPAGLKNPAQVYVGEGRMVVNMPTDEGEDQWVDIQLGPGTVVESPAQALQVLMEAAMGVRHQTLTVPKLAGPQTWAGLVFEQVGDVVKRGLIGKIWDSGISAPFNWLGQTAINAWGHITSLGERPFELPGRAAFRSSSTMFGQQEHEERVAAMTAAVSLEEARLADPEQALHALAREGFVAGMTGPGEALAWAGTFYEQMTDEERDIWQAERTDAARLDAWLAAAEEQPRGFEKWIDDRFTDLITVLDLENQIVMTEGVRFLDTIGDLFQGVMGSLGVPVDGVETIWASGDLVQTWRSAWDPYVKGLPLPGMDKEFEYTRPSEYFQVDNGGLAFAIDVAAMTLDPWIWGTLGAGASARHMTRLLTTRAGVEELLALPSMRRMAWQVSDYAQQAAGLKPVVGVRNPLTQIIRLTSGLPARYVDALFNARSVDEVVSIFRDAMPGGGVGGVWLPNVAGHHMIRNTAQQIRWLGSLSVGTGRRAESVRQFLRRNLGGFSQDRRFSVSPYRGPADYADQVAWLIDDPVRADGYLRSFYADLAALERESLAAGQTATLRMQAATAGLRTVRALRPQEQRQILQRTWAARTRPSGAGYTAEELAEQTVRAERRIAELEQEIRLLPGRYTDPAELARQTSARQAEIGAIQTGRWQELERLHQEVRQIENTTVVQAAKATPGRPLRTQAQVEKIRQNLQEISKIRNEPMIRGLSSADQTMQRMLAENETWMRQVKAAMHEVEEARTLAARAVRPDRRRWMAERHAALWDDVAQDLRLPELAGRTNPLTGGPLYDWSKVTGKAGWKGGVADDVPYLWSLTGGDQALAAEMNRAGFFHNRAWFNAPASPMQVAAYRAIDSEHVWARILGRVTTGQAKTMPGRAVLSTLNAANRAFLTILLSPRIAFRSGMDEIIRYATTTGHVGGAPQEYISGLMYGARPGGAGRRAIGFADEAGSALEYTRLPGAGYASVRQFGPTPKFGERTLRATREEFQSTFAHPTRGLDPSGWRLVGQQAGELGTETVVKNPKLHRNTVMRWVNGTWMGDDAARALSQTITDTARARGLTPWQVVERLEVADWEMGAFATYWQDVGRFYREGLKVTPDGVQLTGMVDGALAGRNALRILGGNSRNADQVIGDLVRRTVEGRTLEVSDSAIIRLWGPMPSDAVGAGAGRGLRRAQDYMTDLMYGVPGENRWGLIHADYYDQALRVLAEGNQGRLMTPQRLAELARGGKVDLGYPGLDVDEAARLFWNNHLELVDDIAFDHGLVTTHMIENVADSFGRQQAAHLMYQPGATSMLGKVVQKSMWPFGPAQWDYLSWWGSEMTKAGFVGLFGQYTQLPNFLNFKAMVQGAPLGALPLNVRLAGRAMDLGGAMAHHVKDPYWDEEDAIEALSPVNLIEEFTFLPRPDSMANFMLDFAPSFGPVPSIFIRMMPDPDGAEPGSWYANMGQELRRFAETVNPGVEWAPSVAGGFGIVEQLVDSFFPNYQGSARDLLGFLFDTAGRLPGAGALRRVGEQVGYNPYERASFDYAYGMMLKDREGLPALAKDTDLYNGFVEDLFARAEELAYSQDGPDTLGKAFPAARLFYQPDDLATPLWEGLVAELPFLLENGLVGENTVRNLLAGWAEYEAGSISSEDAYKMRSGLREILVNLPGLPGSGWTGQQAQARLILRHPELQMALIGRYQCVEDERGLWKAPAEMCTSSGSPQYPAGGEREIADFLAYGRERDWFRELPWADRVWRVEYGLRAAQRTVLADVYMALTGRDRFDPGAAIQARDALTVRLNDTVKKDLALCGAGDVPDVMSGAEFSEMIQNLRKQVEMASPYTYSAGGTAALSSTVEGQQVRDWLGDTAQGYGEENGWDSPADWPEEDRQWVRDNKFRPLIEQGGISPSEYDRFFRRLWGPLDWGEMRPDPPLLQDLDPDVRVLRVNPDDVFVIDGDTIDVMFADGATSRFRFVGINAPDDPMPGADLAYTDLVDLLHHEGHTDLALVFWDLDRYGWQAGTDFKTGKPRWKAWLYVAGEPIFNPDVFTPDEPLGIGPGAEFTRLPRPTEVT